MLSWATPFGATLWAALPSKGRALEKAREGLLAEERVMELEAGAIDALNIHHRNCLESMHMLQRVISPNAWEGDIQAERIFELREKLLEWSLRITRDLHERHQSYNKAENVWRRIEDVRNEVADKEGKEFWGPIVAVVHVERERADEGGEQSCCRTM